MHFFSCWRFATCGKRLSNNETKTLLVIDILTRCLPREAYLKLVSFPDQWHDNLQRVWKINQ